MHKHFQSLNYFERIAFKHSKAFFQQKNETKDITNKRLESRINPSFLLKSFG